MYRDFIVKSLRYDGCDAGDAGIAAPGLAGVRVLAEDLKTSSDTLLTNFLKSPRTHLHGERRISHGRRVRAGSEGPTQTNLSLAAQRDLARDQAESARDADSAVCPEGAARTH